LLSAVFCYRASVKKKLDEQVLASALDHLIDREPLLQMRLENGNYLPVSEGELNKDGRLLFPTNLQAADPDQWEPLRLRVFEMLSREMRPERRSSIRAALFYDGQESCELALLLHRGIGDGKSVALLFEALFRIYEQLSNSRQISLRPGAKSYVDFMRELETEGDALAIFPGNSTSNSNGGARQQRDHAASQSEAGAPKPRCDRVSIEPRVVARMFDEALPKFGLKPGDVLMFAVLRSLAKVNESDKAVVAATIDYRTVFNELARTVAPLTRICRLPASRLSVKGLSSSSLREMKQNLQEAAANSLRGETSSAEAVTARGQRLLFNFEYLIEEPWLGGDQWQPEGFAVSNDELKPGYALEVLPLRTKDGIQIHLTYQDSHFARQLAGAIASQLTQQIQAILNYCQRYLTAKECWFEELAETAGGSALASVLLEVPLPESEKVAAAHHPSRR
jgi:hypothetical protein